VADKYEARSFKFGDPVIATIPTTDTLLSVQDRACLTDESVPKYTKLTQASCHVLHWRPYPLIRDDPLGRVSDYIVCKRHIKGRGQ
jgi:hypothetical protein